jgi:hypothetical protein
MAGWEPRHPRDHYPEYEQLAFFQIAPARRRFFARRKILTSFLKKSLCAPLSFADAEYRLLCAAERHL